MSEVNETCFGTEQAKINAILDYNLEFISH